MSGPILSTRAQADLASIKAYYVEHRSPAAAAKVLQGLAMGVAHIGDYPAAGRRRPELSGDGYDVWSHVVPPYVIYYLNERPVWVTRILHGASDPDFLAP